MPTKSVSTRRGARHSSHKAKRGKFTDAGDELHLDAASKRAYWKVVEACLTRLHHCTKKQAKDLVRDLRERIEATPLGPIGDIFYHAEAFDVACDLAKHPLEIESVRDQYNEILDEFL